MQRVLNGHKSVRNFGDGGALHRQFRIIVVFDHPTDPSICPGLQISAVDVLNHRHLVK